MPVKEAYKRADSILTRAAKGLAEVITKNYDVNIDLEDVRTVLKNSGRSIIGTASSVGDNRAIEAVAGALNSPLLNDNKITGAKKVLLLVTYSPSKPATASELNYISNYLQQEAGREESFALSTSVSEKPSACPQLMSCLPKLKSQISLE